MKTIKNKLLAVAIMGLGIYSAHTASGWDVATMRLAFFAIPGLMLFLAKESIFINDYIDGGFKK